METWMSQNLSRGSDTLVFFRILAPVALEFDDQVQQVVVTVTILHQHNYFRQASAPNGSSFSSALASRQDGICSSRRPTKRSLCVGSSK